MLINLSKIVLLVNTLWQRTSLQMVLLISRLVWIVIPALCVLELILMHKEISIIKPLLVLKENLVLQDFSVMLLMNNLLHMVFNLAQQVRFLPVPIKIL